jgi:hypothetical protein
MLGLIFHRRSRFEFDPPKRTMLVISIGFKRIPIEEQSTEMQERAMEMRDHPAFARSKRFFAKPPKPIRGLKYIGTLFRRIRFKNRIQ